MEYSKLPYVLYKSDFDRMHCCVHFETKNDSAVRIARVLKQMGVEFWYMPLTLKDPSLRNVNPFDPNLSDITKAKIAIECKYNFWYFFRECLQLPLSGGLISPFIFSRANLGTIWTFFNDIDLGLVIPRQCGKSFCTQVLICYMMYVLADNTHMAHIDKSSTNSMNVVKVLKDIRDAMPKWLWQPTTADVENKESISYAKKSNLYSTFAAAIDKVAAGNIARGLSLTVVHFDEIAYIRYNWLTVPAAQAAKLRAAKVARSQGLPAPTMYTTTAGNPDTETGAYALGIFEDAMPFTERLYDLHDHEQLIETIDQNARKRRIYLEFSYQQLGMTDEWFKQASAELNGNPDDIARDLLNVWQASSAENVIPQSITQILRHSKQEPAYTDLSHGFLMRWYLDESIVKSEEFKNRPLVAGMDTSENIGRDWTTLVIMDPRDLNVVATCRCNNANTMQVANYIADLLLEFKGMVWIPERNNTGIAIIDFVLAKLHDNRINPYKRIYNEVIQQRDDPKFAKIDITGNGEIIGKDRSYFGYRTKGSGSTSRDRLYKDVMMHCLELAANKVKDSTLINEYCNLTVRNGRVDHREGLHDDLCFIGSTLVRTIDGNRPIDTLSVGDLVLTRNGYKPICYIHKNDREVITKFGFTGTPDHPFITPSGIVKFKDLKLWSKVYVWTNKTQKNHTQNPSFITERSIIGILIRRALHLDDITIDTISGKNRQLHCTDRSGSITTVLSQRVGTFTTKMATQITTLSKIWKHYPQKNIAINTQCQKKLELLLANERSDSILLENGEQKIQNWHTNKPLRMVMLPNQLQTLGELHTLISITLEQWQPVRKEQHKEHQKSNWLTDAHCNSGTKTILKSINVLWKNLLKPHVNVPRNVVKNRIETVYNLHVADCHEYFANDVLVHNCFAHMMSAYLILQGKNLSFYGISPREVLSTLRSDGGETTAEAKDAQIAIRKRISELEYQLSNPRIAYILRQSYQRELANLRPLVDDKIMESVPLAATQVDDDRREMKSLGVSDGQRLKTFGNQMKQYWQNKNSQPYGWVNRNVVQAAKQFYGN